MAINKVIFGDSTLMDISDTDASAADVASGKVFYAANGVQTVGTADYHDGYTFYPAVSSVGIISWTNDGDLPNPDPVNIKGPQGDTGVYVGDDAPLDSNIQVWIDPDEQYSGLLPIDVGIKTGSAVPSAGDISPGQIYLKFVD